MGFNNSLGARGYFGMYAGLHTLINLRPLADVLINVVLSPLLLCAAGFLNISQVRFRSGGPSPSLDLRGSV